MPFTFRPKTVFLFVGDPFICLARSAMRAMEFLGVQHLHRVGSFLETGSGSLEKVALKGLDRNHRALLFPAWLQRLTSVTLFDRRLA